MLYCKTMNVMLMLQVTITAEQECLYMCWPRLKLERVLRHRPLLKVVLSSIIGEMVQSDVVAQNRAGPEATPPKFRLTVSSQSGMISLCSDSRYRGSTRNTLHISMIAAVSCRVGWLCEGGRDVQGVRFWTHLILCL
jgi:hypothetical protein